MPALPKVDPHRVDSFKDKSQFLTALGDEELTNLRPHMHLVAGKLGEVLLSQGDFADYLYFPLNAVISIVTTVEEGRGVEVALIGSEGLVGLWAALGSNATWHEAVVQVPATALDQGGCIPCRAEAKQDSTGSRSSLYALP